MIVQLIEDMLIEAEDSCNCDKKMSDKQKKQIICAAENGGLKVLQKVF